MSKISRKIIFVRKYIHYFTTVCIFKIGQTYHKSANGETDASKI